MPGTVVVMLSPGADRPLIVKSNRPTPPLDVLAMRTLGLSRTLISLSLCQTVLAAVYGFSVMRFNGTAPVALRGTSLCELRESPTSSA